MKINCYKIHVPSTYYSFGIAAESCSIKDLKEDLVRVTFSKNSKIYPKLSTILSKASLNTFIFDSKTLSFYYYSYSKLNLDTLFVDYLDKSYKIIQEYFNRYSLEITKTQIEINKAIKTCTDLKECLDTLESVKSEEEGVLNDNK